MVGWKRMKSRFFGHFRYSSGFPQNGKILMLMGLGGANLKFAMINLLFEMNVFRREGWKYNEKEH
jgi:hypothetical protein